MPIFTNFDWLILRFETLRSLKPNHGISMESSNSSGMFTNETFEGEAPLPTIRVTSTPDTPTRLVASAHQATPNRFRTKKSPAMIALWSAPLKLTAVDELTPGRENTVLGRAIQSLGINSPATPCTSKVSVSFKLLRIKNYHDPIRFVQFIIPILLSYLV